MERSSSPWVWLCGLLFLGCQSTIGDGSVGGSQPDAPGLGSATPADALGAAATSPNTVLRRLTHWEYDNAIADLLDDDSAPASRFPRDPVVLGFENNAEAMTLAPSLAEAYFDAAERIATAAIDRLEQLAPCAGEERDCALQFIQGFAPRAWRRPVTPDEAQRLLTLYDLGAARRGYAGGIDLVLRELLFAAPFLYRLEFGEPAPDGRTRPTSWEIAARLSFFFWGSVPDAALLQAAQRDELTRPDQILVQAQRLLADPRVEKTIDNFHRQWLSLSALDELDKDQERFPTWSAGVAQLFAGELRAFSRNAVLGGLGVDALFNAEHTFLNAELAGFYGLTGSTAPSGSEFTEVSLADTPERQGILTMGATLATHAHRDQSSPSLRGKFVREQLLCQPLPPPPPGVNNNAPELSPDATTRERFEAHRADPACAACHQLMDSIGLAFEKYDGVGLWRDTENGQSIDVSGELIGTDVDGPFDGVPGLRDKLLQSQETKRCFVRQWFRFAMGRDSSDLEAPLLEELGSAAAAGTAMRDIILALTRSDAFLYR